MRMMVILNPKAGIGQGQKRLKKIGKWRDEVTKEKGIEVNIELTEKSGERNATNLAKRAVKEGFDRIVVVGGDGTVNEVVNGIVGQDIPIGIIPVGVGSDFAKSLGIPQNIKKALKVIIQDKIDEVDLGKVNDRYFANVFGLGFDARVTQFALWLKKKYWFLPLFFSFFLTFKGLYSVAIFRDLLFQLEYPEVKLETEGKTLQGKVTLIAIANGRSYGGMFRIAPEADLRDSFLDICWIKKISRLKILTHLFQVIWGTHIKLPEVEILKASSLTVSAPQNLPCQMDGEVLEAKRKYKITIRPKAIKVLVP